MLPDLPVCGYVRELVNDPDSVASQAESVLAYATAQGLTIAGWFQDAAAERTKTLLARPGGGALFQWLQPGFEVIFPSLAVAFCSDDYAASVLTGLLARGVTVHLAEAGERLAPGSEDATRFLELLRLFSQEGRARRGEGCRETRMRLKAAGRRFQPNAPLGWQWRGRGKRAKLVPHDEEAMVLRWIAEQHRQGKRRSVWDTWSYLTVVRLCPRCGSWHEPERVTRVAPKACPTCGGRTRQLRTKTGRPWSYGQTDRAIKTTPDVQSAGPVNGLPVSVLG
jgi:DNA invertase Pin-like site-specific DNA recombinase